MHKFQTARMPFHQVDAGNARVVNLLEELLEVGSALVPNPCFWEETTTRSTLVDAQAQVDIFAESHGREAAKLSVETAANAQIEGTRIELLVHLLLSATNAASRNERCHAVADGFLNRREALVSTVWTAPSIAFLPV